MKNKKRKNKEETKKRAMKEEKNMKEEEDLKLVSKKTLTSCQTHRFISGRKKTSKKQKGARADEEREGEQ